MLNLRKLWEEYLNKGLRHPGPLYNGQIVEVRKLKYSIILPCYNVTQYLSACMDSLFANDLSDAEIILVNDGSKDEFAGWCKRYFMFEPSSEAPAETIIWQGCAVKIISQRNMGVSAARNTGISHATGEYVLFVDPDDTVMPNYISTISEELAENDCDFLLFGFEEFWEDNTGIITARKRLPLKEYHISSTEEAISELLPNYFGKSLESIRNWLNTGVFNPYQEWGAVWRCVYRRDVIECNGIRFREAIKLNEDGIFNCEYISCISTGKTCMQPLYAYTVRKSGAFRKNWGAFLIKNKLALLEARNQICMNLQDRGYRQVSYLWYAGSNIFSVFELMMNSDFSQWNELKQYIMHPTVKNSVKQAPVSLKKPAYFVLILLFKMNLHAILFLCFRICKRLNIAPNL